MSQERIASIIAGRLTVPGYVPPVSEVRLGMLAAAVGIAPNASWSGGLDEWLRVEFVGVADMSKLPLLVKEASNER